MSELNAELMNADRPIAVYGATGHTGRFVLQELRRRGLPAVAVARRWPPEWPEAASMPPIPAGGEAGAEAQATPAPVPTVTFRQAALDDAAALDRALAGCAVLINCAGPFLDTARPLVQAALRAGCHYIDVTAEQPSAQAVLDEFDAPARAAGVVVMPAAGFYGGLADLLASALMAGAREEASLRVGVALSHWWPTEGTRITGVRNQAQRLVVEDGQLAPLSPAGATPDWPFAEPFGTLPMAELPFSEVVTLSHHLPLRRLHSFISARALQDIRDPATPAPTAVDAQGRSAQRFAMEVVAEGPQPHAPARRAWATGQDIYAVSAPMVVEAAARLRAPGFDGRGAAVLGQLFDARAFLDALAPEHLDFGIA